MWYVYGGQSLFPFLSTLSELLSGDQQQYLAGGRGIQQILPATGTVDCLQASWSHWRSSEILRTHHPWLQLLRALRLLNQNVTNLFNVVISLVTSMILRSDVFVDTISKIEILTTTRELLLGEPPEVCHIQAFDTEGNNNIFIQHCLKN